MKAKYPLSYTTLLTIFLSVASLCANLFLDNQKNNAWVHPSFTYDQQTKELHITLHDVGQTCLTGKKPFGRTIGTYPNPSFKPFKGGFQLNRQSPLCVVFKEPR